MYQFLILLNTFLLVLIVLVLVAIGLKAWSLLGGVIGTLNTIIPIVQKVKGWFGWK